MVTIFVIWALRVRTYGALLIMKLFYSFTVGFSIRYSNVPKIL